MTKFNSFYPPQRKLMGPGPSDISPRVLSALSKPTLGHLDPLFISMMDEVKAMLQEVFKTQNHLTFPISAPASAAMECALVNIIETQDKIIVCRNGVFGMRMSDIVERCGGNPICVDDEWGNSIDLNKLSEAIKQHPDAKAVAFVYAETSTGARSDAASIAKLARQADMLTIADCVTALGGIELDCDKWGLDIVYAGTQKCLSAPPGLAPFTINKKALNIIRTRKSKVPSWFLDLALLDSYWQGTDKKRSYHHTAPVNNISALHEALVMLLEEGLATSCQRHLLMHEALKAGIKCLGMDFIVDENWRLPQLNAISIPQSVDDAKVRGLLLNDYGLEIGGGLGNLADKVWRVGLMGYGARTENVLYFLNSIEAVLISLGVSLPRGKAANAALEVIKD